MGSYQVLATEITFSVGELPDKLEEKAFQMLRLLSECIIAASTTKECPISDGSMEWFTNGLENVKPNIVQNPSQVYYYCV